MENRLWSHRGCHCGGCHHHCHLGADPAEDVQQENEDQAGAGAQEPKATCPSCPGPQQQWQPAACYCDLRPCQCPCGDSVTLPWRHSCLSAKSFDDLKVHSAGSFTKFFLVG
ncbi:RIKEN cDNA A330049M08, isoform CRA_b [Mus musculus]|nr:RIKEN cDNA A330049M08, isoform CRA_b [Mus musculus]